jgi:ethanolamine ammonia-lyase small subunit
VGAILGARLVLVLIGERPGLTSPDSLGAYLTLSPRLGCTDADRNCISNIRPEGMDLPEAARRILWLTDQAMTRGLSGVLLKDDSDVRLLRASDAPAVPGATEP